MTAPSPNVPLLLATNVLLFTVRGSADLRLRR